MDLATLILKLDMVQNSPMITKTFFTWEDLALVKMKIIRKKKKKNYRQTLTRNLDRLLGSFSHRIINHQGKFFHANDKQIRG